MRGKEEDKCEWKGKENCEGKRENEKETVGGKGKDKCKVKM